MKLFTKILLSAYPKIPHLTETMDGILKECALKSFYDRADGYLQAERLAKKIERRAALVRLKALVDLGVEALPSGERAVLFDRFSMGIRAYDKARYCFAKTTYYRKLKRGISRLEEYLESEGAEELYRSSGLNKTAYFRFLKDEIKARQKRKEEAILKGKKSPVTGEKREKTA